jgi:hypothetical protein
MGARWPRERELELTRLVKSRKFDYHEIGRIMGLNRNQVVTKSQALGLKNPVYLLRKTKHKHLHGPLLRYYLNHSAEQCQDRFGFTPSEFKSCLTYAYKDPNLRRVRKETRRHDAWSLKEKLFLIQHAGIQPRAWIARKLRRGGVHSVKEELERLQMNSKFVNGMPRKYLLEILGPRDCPEGIKTKAGPPGGGRGDFRFIIIPWTECEQLSRRFPRRFDPETKAGIRGMAMFQRWVFGLKDGSIVKRIEAAANER